jgi:hypothetical protein
MQQTIHPKKQPGNVSGVNDLAQREYMDQMRKRTGNINSRDPLVSFLYTLMRDHLTPGQVEEIMLRHMPKQGEVTEFCNGHLACYAEDVAERIHDMEPKPEPPRRRKA